MPPQARPKQYPIQWPLSEAQVEHIDEMFGTLFRKMGQTTDVSLHPDAGTIVGIVMPPHGGTGTGVTFTEGSVVFAGPSGNYAQDNANFFWDDTNNVLGLGTASPLATHRLTVNTLPGSSNAFRLRNGDDPRYRSDGQINLNGLNLNAFDDTAGAFLPIRLIGLTEQFYVKDATTGVANIDFLHETSAIPIAGFGLSARFLLNSATVVDQEAAAIAVAWTDPANATRTASIAFQTVNNAGALTTRVTLDGPGRMGVGITPTAFVHLKAGTATANTAPLKFTSGTLLGTAEAGAIEFLTDDYYATITTGAARKKFVLDDGTALTSGRVPFATTNGRLTDDADLTFSVDTLTATKLLAPTSISSPSHISTGAITITPNAGSNLNVALSTTGDFAVNTNQLYVDTSAAQVGINTSTPDKALTVEGAMSFKTGGTTRGFIGPPTWTSTYMAMQNGSLSESASNFAIAQSSGGETIVNSSSGNLLFLRINNDTQIAATGGNLVIGPSLVAADFPGSGRNGLFFKDGTAPTSLGSQTAGVYSDDVETTVEMFAIGELGELSRLTGVACRNSAQFDKTDTTLATVTGLTRNVQAGKTYKFEAVLFVTANVTGGSKYAIAGTATATAIIYDIVLLDEGTSANTISSRQTALGGSAGQAGTTSGLCRISGTIVVNAAGTLLVQFAQNAASGTSSIVANSTFTLTQVP